MIKYLIETISVSNSEFQVEFDYMADFGLIFVDKLTLSGDLM